MITIRGENPETVALPELQDFVYYKQVKTFSEEEYKKSSSLQKAISKGNVLVLKRVDEKFSNFGVPQAVQGVQGNNPSDVTPLLELLKNLEAKIDQTSAPSSNVIIELLIKKIEDLEKKIQTPVLSDNSALAETVRRLEDRVNQTTSSPSFQKLEDILTKLSGITTKLSPEKVTTPDMPEEVYVPNIKVEDGNSHINLKVRTIEKSDDINSAAAALRKMKKPT